MKYCASQSSLVRVMWLRSDSLLDKRGYRPEAQHRSALSSTGRPDPAIVRTICAAIVVNAPLASWTAMRECRPSRGRGSDGGGDCQLRFFSSAETAGLQLSGHCTQQRDGRLGAQPVAVRAPGRREKGHRTHSRRESAPTPHASLRRCSALLLRTRSGPGKV